MKENLEREKLKPRTPTLLWQQRRSADEMEAKMSNFDAEDARKYQKMLENAKCQNWLNLRLRTPTLFEKARGKCGADEGEAKNVKC